MPGPVLRRWVATLAVAVLAAALCTAAGLWQWQRHLTRSAAVAVVLEHQDSPPAPLDRVLVLGQPLPADQQWRPVAVTGRYLQPSVLLRNRPVNGTAGYHVIAGLEVVDGPLTGAVLVVDRGWVPLGPDGSAPDAVPEPPSGEVELVARLRADERPSDRAAPAGQVQALSTEQVRLAAGEAWPTGATLAATAQAVTENGSGPARLGDLTGPSTSLGSHLSYAFQWWVFALGALGGAVVLLRRDAHDRRVADGAVPTLARRTARRTAEQDEDDWLDAQAAAER